VKSHDIVLLLKLVSLHNTYFSDCDDEEFDVIYPPDEEQDWLENGLADEDSSSSLAGNNENVKNRFSVRALEADTGISKSQISLSLNRMYNVGLAKIDRKLQLPKTNTQALLEFIAYGIKYVFPVKEGEITRGIATSIAAPVLRGKLMTSGDLPPVWPYAKGKTKGMAIEPLHSNIFKTVQKDKRMYAMLALVDAIRIGHARERNVALEKLKIIFKAAK
jgi:hypothetical protein